MLNNQDPRLQNLTNAKQLREVMQQIEGEQQRQLYIENQQIVQAEELKKQTLILEEARILTNKNAEYAKQALESALKSQKSSNRQFLASIIISGVALIVAILTFIK